MESSRSTIINCWKHSYATRKDLLESAAGVAKLWWLSCRRSQQVLLELRQCKRVSVLIVQFSGLNVILFHSYLGSKNLLLSKHARSYLNMLLSTLFITSVFKDKFCSAFKTSFAISFNCLLIFHLFGPFATFSVPQSSAITWGELFHLLQEASTCAFSPLPIVFLSGEKSLLFGG